MSKTRNSRRPGRTSQHAYGNAIDINPSRNPFRTSQTDMPPSVSAMAAKWGLSWGGDWSARSRDPMHFEWDGSRPWENKKGPTATADNKPATFPFGLTSGFFGSAKAAEGQRDLPGSPDERDERKRLHQAWNGIGGQHAARMAGITRAVQQTSFSHAIHHNDNSVETKIGALNIHTQATDAAGIAADIQPILQRGHAASRANYGLA